MVGLLVGIGIGKTEGTTVAGTVPPMTAALLLVKVLVCGFS